ncbi:MAG: ABC transporter permease [Verrucomicrobia bacterium]|nr:MAG: ABC transporter permease [Verrucomicrobiota bacterium]
MNNTPDTPESTRVSHPGYSPAVNSHSSVTIRPLYWSVRRELWENRSLYVAPLIVAVVVLFGFLISTVGMPQRRQAVLLLDAAHQRAAIGAPYDIAAMMLILTAFIVGVFYCLDALHGERRDRSILFWKSLPVSDLTTVLSKVSVPLIILPLTVFGIIVLVQFLMLLWSSAILLPSGLAATTWTRFNLFQQSVILLYSLIVIMLWHAPIYAWALLISGWARRATFLWAVLPLLAIGVLEKFAFDTSHFASMVKDRVFGAGDTAFAFHPHHGIAIDSLLQLTPGRYLATPGLWIGLAFAAVFVVVAVRLRRYRGPI